MVSVEIRARDLMLFRKLNAAGWLTTRQILDYFFPGKSTNAVCKRLRKLVEARYLAIARFSSTEPALYRLAGQAKLALIEHSNLNERDITIPSQLPRKLKHFTKVNDLRFCFEQLKGDLGVKLIFFFSERELCLYYRNPEAVSDVILSLLKRYNIIPDAIARIRITDKGSIRDVDLALEFDAGTEHAVFFGRTKVKQYAALFARNQDWLGDFKALTFTPSIKRIVSLMQQTVRYEPPRNIFYFAPVEKLEQKGWESIEIFLNPFDFFIRVREGSRIETVGRGIHKEGVSKYALANLPENSPCKVSSREERGRQDKLWNAASCAQAERLII